MHCYPVTGKYGGQTLLTMPQKYLIFQERACHAALMCWYEWVSVLVTERVNLSMMAKTQKKLKWWFWSKPKYCTSIQYMITWNVLMWMLQCRRLQIIIITWPAARWICWIYNSEQKRSRGNTGYNFKNTFKYFSAGVWHLTLCEMR